LQGTHLAEPANTSVECFEKAVCSFSPPEKSSETNIRELAATLSTGT
jgi:hypothetical protein